jgi:predicted lipid-binding transport protein (Tim44 family)
LLVQVLLIGGLAYLGVRLFRGWSAARVQPAGSASAYAAPPRLTEAPMARSGGPLLVGSAAAQLAITAEDYTTFEGLLGDIQTAYGKGDLAKLRGLATPEMLGYFSEQLSANASRGIENKVEAVKLEQGDLSEAWSEAGLDYATVAMRFSMIDVTRTLADGKIVDGSDHERTEATEVWTFLRSRGGQWILSAIQQT